VSHRSSASRLGLPVSSSSLSLKKKKKQITDIYIGFFVFVLFSLADGITFFFSSSVFLPMFSLQSYCYLS
jgi:hypothetical protein